MASAALHLGQTVELTADKGRIIIQPILSPLYDLDQMVDAMAPDTFPENVDFGPPLGGEAGY